MYATAMHISLQHAHHEDKTASARKVSDSLLHQEILTTANNNILQNSSTAFKIFCFLKIIKFIKYIFESG